MRRRVKQYIDFSRLFICHQLSFITQSAIPLLDYVSYHFFLTGYVEVSSLSMGTEVENMVVLMDTLVTEEMISMILFGDQQVVAVKCQSRAVGRWLTRNQGKCVQV